VVEKQWLACINPRKWTPGEHKTEAADLKFTTATPGSYKLAVGLFSNQDEKRPAYRLGIQGRTSDGWYILGDVTLLLWLSPPAGCNVSTMDASLSGGPKLRRPVR